jgi:hypothetical protein
MACSRRRIGSRGVLRIVVSADSVGTQQDSGKAMVLPRSGDTIHWDDGHGNVCKARETVVAEAACG